MNHLSLSPWVVRVCGMATTILMEQQCGLAAQVVSHCGGHGGDHGAAVRFEQIGPHARHVAHVVGDDTGIARVILGDAFLNFAGLRGYINSVFV